MPRVSNIEILQRTGQPILSVRKRTPVENMPQVISEAYGKMAARLKEAGVFLSDVPFVMYHNMDLRDLDVEMCFPVAKPLEGSGEVKAGCIPAGKFVFCIYRGPYTEMEPVYAEMSQWIADNGLKYTGISYEHYYNGNEFPPSEALTMVLMPVETL